MKLAAIVSVAALAAASTVASAQWFDNFDSYPVGSINGQTTGGPNALGTWQGWDNDPLAAGDVSTAQALSGPNSQRIATGDDSVHRFTGVTSGAWTFQISQFIPTAYTGNTHFILNNDYADLGPYQWAVQLDFLGTSSTVVDALRPPSNPVNFVRGQWATIRVDFNLTTNTVSQFYNGNLVKSGTWLTGTATNLSLEAVDLFRSTGTEVFYDNASLVPAPSSLALLAMGGVVAGRRRR